MNLCFGYSLERAVKAIAFFQLLALLVGVGLIVVFSVGSYSQHYYVHDATVIKIYVGVSALVSFALGCLLYTAVTTRSISRINAWLAITWPVFILTIVKVIVASDSKEGVQEKLLYIIVGLIILTSLFLCVVHAFKREVKRDEGPKSSRRDNYDDDRWTDAVIDVLDFVSDVK